ncbi:Hpt domain-containing protein [Algoriphagus namhaensis]|uniref:Hpt domain-containing protein n=1 Tax=Algoriphagus namhaensis TaxID=915353 RepID=A0ABV8AUU9_9BACT
MQNRKKSANKILIIEDVMLHQKIFQNLLGKFYELKIANSLAEASEYLISDSPNMIIMDLHIDGYDGRYCLEYPNLSIPVLATSSTITLRPAQYKELGFSGFIKKPASAKEILKIVAEAIEMPPQQLLSKENIPLINPGVLKDLLKYNSSEKIIEIFQVFIQEARTILSEAKEALIEHNQQKFTDNLHTLKGNSGTLGAEKIHHLATSAQELARNNRLKETKDLLPELEREIQDLEITLITPQIFEI